MGDFVAVNRLFLIMAREAAKQKSGELLTGLSRSVLDRIGGLSLDQIEQLSKVIGLSAIQLRLTESEIDRLIGLSTDTGKAYALALAVTNRSSEHSRATEAGNHRVMTAPSPM